MTKSDEFISEFGESVFDEVCSVIYGDFESSRVQIKNKFYSDSINSSGEGVILIDSKTISFHFEDGNRNGTEIMDYGESLDALRHYMTIYRFILDEERIGREGKEDAIPLMQKKFEALKDEIANKEREYNYDIRQQPSIKIESHYTVWCKKRYLKIVSEQVKIS